MSWREFIMTLVSFCTVGYGLVILGYWLFGDLAVQSGLTVLVALPVWVYLRARRSRR